MSWARVVLDAVVVLWWVRLVVAVAGRPASRWPARWWGKAFSLAVALLGCSLWFGVVLPYGAVWVWWKVMVRGRDPFELPMADGRRMP